MRLSLDCGPMVFSSSRSLALTAFLALVGAAVAPMVGCDATGDIEGGDPFDGGTQVTTLEAGGGSEGGSQSSSCAAPDAGTGSTFTDLYRDYFGPNSTASCSGTAGACHGDASGAGALGSGGFVCGTSQADCFTGMNVTTADLLSTSDTAHPENSGLEVALRKATAGGINNMPLDPPNTCVFTDADIARISAWVAAGAQNN